MKKYHIADILTASRFVFAMMIVAMTFFAASPAKVLAVFVIGEITDAADGPAASRWPYPEKLEKTLWWRVNKVAFDMTADIALGVATLFYMAEHTYPFGAVLLKGALIIGAVTQFAVLFILPPADTSAFTKNLILFRRAFLYVPTIAAAVILLLLKATIPGELTWAAVQTSEAFLLWLGIGLAIGAALFYLKWDRVIQVARGAAKPLENEAAAFRQLPDADDGA